MAGRPDMTLHGWRQLIEWSIEHSCMDPEERAVVYGAWLVMWNNFCQDIIDGYEHKLIEENYLEAADGGDEVMHDVGVAGRRG